MVIVLRLLLIVPLAAAVIVAFLGAGRVALIRWISLLATVLTLVLAASAAYEFADYQQTVWASESATFRPVYVTQFDVLPLGSGAIQFHIGLDGLNVWLVLLTALLMVPSVLVSWHSPQVHERHNEYFAWLLALETVMIGVFLSFDIILFYVFFELTLIPLFFLIGIWGGAERRYAARKFFIYTLAGSLLTFLGLLGLVIFCYSHFSKLTFSIPELVTQVGQLVENEDAVKNGYLQVQKWIFLAMMAGFAVKVPLVPFHTWLPLAHVEAPTAGSVLLAGVLLKIGTYGFLRLCLPLAPDACVTIGAPLIASLAVIGIIYGAICALSQPDIKKLVAYSSVSHLGFCMLGMFALNMAGLSGSLMQMINHGLSTGALFLLVGMLYDRYHTRLIADYSGMAGRLHLLGFFMVFICLSSVGLPGLNGFVGEILVFMGAYEWRAGYAVAASAGVVLGAWYLLRLLRKVFFGPLHEPVHEGHHPIRDLNGRELAALIPIALLCIVIGVYPQPILKASQRDLRVVADIAQAARQRAETPMTGSLATSLHQAEKTQ